MKELWQMFFAFARIGGLTFGGGYAMLPMLQKEVVEKNHWATEEELMDYYAIGQCTPGIIALNTSTFIGYKFAGLPGAVLASVGFLSPSIVIITIIAAFLQNFAELNVVAYAFSGIRICVCMLILDAVIKLGKKAVVDKFSVIVFAVIAILALFTPVPTVALVLLSGVAGYVFTEDGSDHDAVNRVYTGGRLPMSQYDELWERGALRDQ